MLAKSIQKQRNYEDFPLPKSSRHQNDDYDVILSN